VPHIEARGDGLGELDMRTVPQMNAFALEGLYQSAWFEASETKLLSSDVVAPASYVRGHVGLCRIQGEGFMLDVYPVLKVYSTGVVQVAFRMIAPEEQEFSVEDFVHGPRNLARQELVNVQIPESLLKANAQSEANCNKTAKLKRRTRKKLASSIPKFIEQHAVEVDTGSFAFRLAPLFSKGLSIAMSKEGQVAFRPAPPLQAGFSLNELSETILTATSYALGRAKTPKKPCSPLKRGGYWRGKPNIYITKHTEQQELAKDNQDMHGRAFGDIMSGVICDSERQARSFLPESSRSFSDFGWYIAQEAVLIVWAASGLKMLEARKNVNRGHLVYEQHAVSEILDYGYALHRKALELAGRTETPEEAYKAQEALIGLKQTLQHASPYGEIQHLLRTGWDNAGVDSVYDMVTETLRIRGQRSVERQHRTTTSWTHLVTTTLGVLAALGISGQVVKPLWTLLKWPLCRSNAAQALIYVGISACLTLLILGGLRVWHRFRSRS